MAARPAAGRTRGFVHFLSRAARHLLVEEGTRTYLTLPTISHSLSNVSSLQQHFLDDQRKFATFIYIQVRPRLMICPAHLALHFRNFDTLRTLAIPGPACAIHSSTDDKDSLKPPPRRIGQEATAAPHRARNHRRAASGKKPPPRRIGQEATAVPYRASCHSRGPGPSCDESTDSKPSESLI